MEYRWCAFAVLPHCQGAIYVLKHTGKACSLQRVTSSAVWFAVCEHASIQLILILYQLHRAGSAFD